MTRRERNFWRRIVLSIFRLSLLRDIKRIAGATSNPCCNSDIVIAKQLSIKSVVRLNNGSKIWRRASRIRITCLFEGLLHKPNATRRNVQCGCKSDKRFFPNLDIRHAVSLVRSNIDCRSGYVDEFGFTACPTGELRLPARFPRRNDYVVIFVAPITRHFISSCWITCHDLGRVRPWTCRFGARSILAIRWRLIRTSGAT